MIEYRRAEIDDIDALSQLRVNFICEGKDVCEKDKVKLIANIKLYLQKSMNDESFVAWLAVEEGKIVGTSGLTIYMLPPNLGCPNGKTGYISNMYTIPEYRSKGIATKIFSLTVDEAKNRGCERILLNATEMGRPIYEKYGFEDTKSAMSYYPFQKSSC